MNGYDVRNKIIIAISGTDVFLEQSDFPLDFDTTPESTILDLIEPAVREHSGQSLRDSGGWLYKVRKASERRNIYVIPNSTAGANKYKE